MTFVGHFRILSDIACNLSEWREIAGRDGQEMDVYEDLDPFFPIEPESDSEGDHETQEVATEAGREFERQRDRGSAMRVQYDLFLLRPRSPRCLQKRCWSWRI